MKPHKGSLYNGNIVLEAFQIINPRKLSKETVQLSAIVTHKLQNMYFENT